MATPMSTESSLVDVHDLRAWHDGAGRYERATAAVSAREAWAGEARRLGHLISSVPASHALR
jgi:hypothetical protein